jgi:uncharacterized protein (TIGR00290 family)
MKVLVSWSSGKDSAWTLHVLRAAHPEAVGALLTTVNAQFGRVSMHGVRRALLRTQAVAAGLPLIEVPLPSPCPNEIYEVRMREALDRARREGFTHVAFGDLFLADVRRYREARLAGTGLDPLFPLWARPTAALAREMLAGGLKARVVTVDPAHLDASLVGREFDAAFLDGLPPRVDPCGENGEFHTFAYAGPMFAVPVAIRNGEVVARDGVTYGDLVGDEDTETRPGGDDGQL